MRSEMSVSVFLIFVANGDIVVGITIKVLSSSLGTAVRFAPEDLVCSMTSISTSLSLSERPVHSESSESSAPVRSGVGSLVSFEGGLSSGRNWASKCCRKSACNCSSVLPACSVVWLSSWSLRLRFPRTTDIFLIYSVLGVAVLEIYKCAWRAPLPYNPAIDTNPNNLQTSNMTRFRPCIDLHSGQVKQIVGGTLSEKTSDLQTNHVSQLSASYFANLYKARSLTGGHVILLGPGNEEAAKQALSEWPQGLQVGGGINEANARQWIEWGAEKVG